MEYLFATFLAIGTGLATAAQSPTNAALGTRIGAVQASFISFLGGLILLSLTTLLFGTGNFFLIFTATPWKVLGGVYGAYIVFIMAFCSPKLGVALMLTVFMLGQLLGGMVVDGLGLLEATWVPVSPLRVIGCVLVLAGIMVVYVGRLRQDGGVSKQPDVHAKMLLYMLLAFSGGIVSSIQTPTNAALAAIAGTIEASTMNFVTGTTLLCIASLILGKGKLPSLKGAKPWQCLGGLYGAIGVPSLTAAVPVLGVSLTLGGCMVGQLFGGLIVDAKGWLGMSKIPVDKLRLVGAVVLTLGVVLVTLSKM